MADDENLGSPDDLDYIGEEGTGPTWGDAFSVRTSWASPTPVLVPKTSTPLLDDATDVGIPNFALWCMKYLRHAHLFGRAEVDIRQSFGEGDHAVYILDDGRNHCLVSRKVGTSPDGCIYCLVGQIPIEAYDEFVSGASPDSAFDDARSLSLCAVFDAPDGVSNVAVSDRYGVVDEVPPEYLPPSPPIAFTQ